MKIKTIKCNKFNYNYWYKRKYKEIEAIVIHNTASSGHDTAENNGVYFKRERVGASANYFIDRAGNIVRSIPMCRIAYAVESKGMKLIDKWRNYNTVSIELCDIMQEDISEKQLEALKYLIGRIKKKCKKPNMEIIRHYDVCRKNCPARYVDNKKFEELKRRLTNE